MTPPLPLALNRAKYRPEFAEWLIQNQALWLAFCRESNRIWDRGRRHWSARTVIEYMRHQTALSEVGGEFKINNNWAPDMARLFAEQFPERASLFEFRVMPGSARAA